MATRYYLIPCETDPEKLRGMVRAPKYLNLLTRAHGLIPILVDYYVVKAVDIDFASLEANADVVLLYPNADRAALKLSLQNLGIDVSSLKGSWTFETAKSSICKWLLGNDSKDYIGLI